MIEVPLDKGKVALVDDQDASRVLSFKWRARPPVHDGYSWYADRWEKGRTIWLHRFVLALTDRAVFVDHRDGDGLNCQRDNMRACTRSQNRQNSRRVTVAGRFKGVWRERSERWRAHIRVNGRLIIIGRFDTEHEAALAYNAAAKVHFGDFACLNDVGGQR